MSGRATPKLICDLISDAETIFVGTPLSITAGGLAILISAVILEPRMVQEKSSPSKHWENWPEAV